MKTVIIGNCGSGKSFLSRQFTNSGARVIHLDQLFWEEGGCNKKRPMELIKQEINELIEIESWIVEGVFGDLASYFIPFANKLIWLDLDWKTCEKNIITRGPEHHEQKDSLEVKENFKKLLIWAEGYWKRDDLRSWKGHSVLFENFTKEKIMLPTKSAINTYIETLTKESTEFVPNR